MTLRSPCGGPQHQSGEVELLSRIVPKKFEGRKIILLDELLDNGHTMHTMCEHLMKELKIPRSEIRTCVLFSKIRPDRPKEYDADIVGIASVPNVWLVGYGLDDNGTKRGWTELFAKPKAPGLDKVPEDTMFDDTDEGRKVLFDCREKMLGEIYA